jgi:hypothetical protein
LRAAMYQRIGDQVLKHLPHLRGIGFDQML